jgi:CDP-diacylglycerol--glycerol-3-phosphate 3-phosphatidyltransferase
VDLDGRGLLVASLLVYQNGQVGWWFLLVGAARYVFVFGSWLRRRRGLSVQKLKENLGRRALAGTQMGLTTALLAPVFSPPETTLAAALFMIPFIANFSYDWLSYNGISYALASRFSPLYRQRDFVQVGIFRLHFSSA